MNTVRPKIIIAMTMNYKNKTKKLRQKTSNKQQKQATIKTTQIKINRKVMHQKNKLHSQQSNQQMLLTRRKSPNLTKLNNKKHGHFGITSFNNSIKTIGIVYQK